MQPENVLLKHGGSFPTVLICDFGLATPFRSPTSVSAKIKAGSVTLPRVTPGAVRAPSILGTPLYFPPEYIVAKHEQELASSRRRLKLEQRGRPPAVAQGGGHLDATALDVWAVGVIAWIMTTGTHPFGNDDGPACPSLNAALSAIDSDGLSSSLEISSLEAAIQRRSFDRRVVAGDVRSSPPSFFAAIPGSLSLISLATLGAALPQPGSRILRPFGRRLPRRPPPPQGSGARDGR